MLCKPALELDLELTDAELSLLTELRKLFKQLSKVSSGVSRAVIAQCWRMLE